MGQDYDKIIKENIEDIILPLARKVLDLPEPEGMVEIPDDLQYTIERKPDFLKLITDKAGTGQYVLQLEFQTRDEPDMLSRMLFYAAQLYGRYKLPIRQYVFYIGKRPARMPQELTLPDLSFRYHVRNVIDVDYVKFLETDKPEEAVLAILGNLGTDSPTTAVERILATLKRLATGQLALGKSLRQLEVLLKLRNVQNEVIKQIERMPIVYDLETDIRYLQGRQKGAEEALLKGLQEGLRAGEEATKQADIRGLLQLGLLTPEQIATALNVSVDLVLSMQAKRSD